MAKRAQTLRELRIERDQTMEEAAVGIGKILGRTLSKTSVQNYESGTRVVPLDVANAWAAWLGISVDDVIAACGLTLPKRKKKTAS